MKQTNKVISVFVNKVFYLFNLPGRAREDWLGLFSAIAIRWVLHEIEATYCLFLCKFKKCES